MGKRILFLFLVIAAAGVAAWGSWHLIAQRRQHQSAAVSTFDNSTNRTSWAVAVEKVKADRGPGAYMAVETPPELRHYSDRHWFLATQVAEIAKYNVHTCQDYVDLAGMIQRGELVAVPGVTDSYVLYGVAAKADDSPFTKYQDDHSIELYSEAQLNDAYQRINAKRSNLSTEIASLKVQLGKLSKRDRTKQTELQKQIAEREQDLKSTEEDKALLDQFYGQPDSRRKLTSDYEALQTLAKNFMGRSYNIDDPSDRQAMKANLLGSLKPEALRILEEVASAYHRQFDRPLPVSSLVRPEQYQHALSRVNRNAVVIDTPPHSTGLAFDIDYRFMGGAEQTFVMAELARLKNEGRIEVIRERNANYHVFAFVNGTRPNDELIAASLEKAGADVEEANHATEEPTNVKSKPEKAQTKTARSKASAAKSKAIKPNSKARKRR